MVRKFCPWPLLCCPQSHPVSHPVSIPDLNPFHFFPQQATSQLRVAVKTISMSCSSENKSYCNNIYQQVREGWVGFKLPTINHLIGKFLCWCGRKRVIHAATGSACVIYSCEKFEGLCLPWPSLLNKAITELHCQRTQVFNC